MSRRANSPNVYLLQVKAPYVPPFLLAIDVGPSRQSVVSYDETVPPAALGRLGRDVRAHGGRARKRCRRTNLTVNRHGRQA